MSHADQHLFEPAERDACGTGFVADRTGKPSHAVLQEALGAVCRLEHRGAVSPDGRTSDGAGILAQIPWRLIAPDRQPDQLALAALFVAPSDDARARALFEDVCTSCDLTVEVWRDVPFEDDVVGIDAKDDCPRVLQVIVSSTETDHDARQRSCFHAHRVLERRAVDEDIELSVISFSSTTVVYKARVVPSLLAELYPDLADPRFETAVALFHQRYSTNTHPSWRLAQPFSYLAHNGEINTLQGNINRMAARHERLTSDLWGEQLQELLPVIRAGGSDSKALDDALAFLVATGRDLPNALSMLVPEAYEANPTLDPARRELARYRSALMEPWDGPASLVFSDGIVAGAALDRNGLRPLRYWVTDDRVIVGSEAGIVPVDGTIRHKGRLGPGEMLLVDLRTGAIRTKDELETERAADYDWVGWARERVSASSTDDSANVPGLFDEELVRVQKGFGYGREHIERVLAPMATDGKIPVGSMGDDTPLAVLSDQPQRLYGYFMQRFAQVTNPAIDPLRERSVMSLTTRISLEGQLLETRPETRLFEFGSPVVSAGELAWLAAETEARRIDITYDVEAGLDGLERTLERLRTEAENAVDDGAVVLILSDRAVGADRVAAPMLLALGAVFHHLIGSGRGADLAIVCDAGDVIEDHDVAALLGFGATLVHPWLAYESAAAVARKVGDDEAQAVRNLRTAYDNGLLKIMAKLGISDVNSYRGAQTFEALGVASEVVERCFTGCPSRIGGVDLRDIAASVFAFHAEAHGDDRLVRELGIYRFRRDGEYHAFHPGVFKWLHKAVRESDVDAYRKYAEAVDNRPPTSLRDLMQMRPAGHSIPLDEVEPAETIAQRFCTQAMSFGSLSRETHELLAISMNKLGGKSNSGEGGEEPVRLRAYTEDAPDRSVAKWHPVAGDRGTSAIKQVASGRFGVTPDYLVSAEQIEIKMAQGSKPGEGGQIPGFKVTEDIAATRRAQAGMPLISPPPHHDIYSIEDLAQLIYDLKRVNQRASVAVKLVSVVGVGTIATGVAKGYADCIQISGHDGGTGASPLGSIKHAGLPWELGLGEVQQRLVANDLRGRVRLRVDGGLKTGRDVVIAAMLGAEEFGFGTAALVAAGCVMARRCHSNTCPVGVATQREDLRARFPGRPEHVISFMLFVAEHVRMILAELGLRSLDDVVGRVDLLESRDGLPERAQRVDLSRLLWSPAEDGRAVRQQVARNDRPEPKPLDALLVEAAAAAGWDSIDETFPIDNTQRAVGARLAGEISLRGLHPRPDTFSIRFDGVSGQSFGAFCNEGMRLELRGEAQDYVAKSMAGGTVLLRPEDWGAASGDWVIMGNTCAYGATGGTLFAAGVAGERLAVRNSGATVVVEGCGDHGCEYMTGGVVVVLGKTGRNFGAGMTGGVAYVWDPDSAFESRCNLDAVALDRPSVAEADALLRVIEAFADATQSPRAKMLLDDPAALRTAFRVVSPRSEEAAQVETRSA